MESPRLKLTCSCVTCRVKHESFPSADALTYHVNEFQQKHLSPACDVEFYSSGRTVPKGFAGSALDKSFERNGVAPWWLNHPEFAPNANIKLAWASSAAFTYTSVNSLASDTNLLAGASSLAVDNTSNLYLDYLVSGFCKNNTSSAPTVSKEIDVYAYNSFDDTPTYPDTIAGTDATKTITTANILASALSPFGSTLIAATTSQVNVFRGKAISQAFGGITPKLWGLFIVHNSGQALAATGNTWSYAGAYLTSV